MEDSEYMKVEIKESRAFIERCICSLGTNPAHSATLAELLICADTRGHFSHGLNRIDVYIKDIEAGITEKYGDAVILKELPGTAWVDGKNLLGPVVGKFCMNLAIRKAKEAGIGLVVAKGSNHFGIAGWYSMQAMKTGLVGLSFTNTSPCTVPTRSREVVLGTNPLSCSAPARDGDSFTLDMATTTVALGKVEICHLRKEHMPPGWGCDSNGKATTDPSAVLKGGGLLPLGGLEISGGYKATGLAMMVEVLTGVLGGALFGSMIRKFQDADRPADLGHCFIAINPDAFAPAFTDRMTSLIDMCRSAEPAIGEAEVLVAGDPERRHEEKVKEEGGINYHKNLIRRLDALAVRLGVDPIRCK